jgi:hypothetical protein
VFGNRLAARRRFVRETAVRERSEQTAPKFWVRLAGHDGSE